jgi:hypothetical protein
MFKPLLVILFLCAQAAFAQDLSRDLEFIDTQNSASYPFGIPLYVGLDGQVNIISKSDATGMSFRPTGQVFWNRTSSLYIKPVQTNSFSFSEQKADLEWIQVKRKRMEIGLGLGASLTKLPISVGLTPYKGARAVIIRQTINHDQKIGSMKLPKDLEEMRDWTPGDEGSFQTYGGVELSVSANYAIATIVNLSVTVQSLFSVVIQKTQNNNIHLSISEENLNKRRIQSGVIVGTATMNYFNGKRLSTNFILNLDNPRHHELYELAIKGKLSELQRELPAEAQRMTWKGHERIGYFGVPGVAGKYFTRAEYAMDFDGEEDVLDVKTRRSSGLFLPLRNHNKMVYQTESALILFWYSEMNKADEEVLSRKFLIPGRVMGAKGFDSVLPVGTKIGSTLSQMGLSFTREELDNVTPELLESVLKNFKERCELLEQSCAGVKTQKKIGKTLRGFLGKKWEDVRDKLGFIMLDEPALIHSYIKAIKAKKSVYFKFLNEKYQSLEGAAAIVI